MKKPATHVMMAIDGVDFSEFYAQDRLSDVNLILGEEDSHRKQQLVLPCHSLLLATHSKYFSTRVSRNDNGYVGNSHSNVFVFPSAHSPAARAEASQLARMYVALCHPWPS